MVSDHISSIENHRINPTDENSVTQTQNLPLNMNDAEGLSYQGRNLLIKPKFSATNAVNKNDQISIN